MPFSSVMNGQKVRMNRRVGVATSSAVPSGFCRATVLGASSPKTMCSAVMKANAIATAAECDPACAQGAGTPCSVGSISRAMAGSPIQPRPRLAMVIPSCVAAM